jgi:hypothetical protein
MTAHKLMRALRVTSLALCLSLIACATGDKSKENPEWLFIDASSHLRDRVTVHGFLRYASEDRSLYPLGTTLATRSRRECLPVLVRRGDESMLSAVKELSDTLVVIDGVIVPAVGPGMISVNSCRQYGIEILAVRRDD